MDDMIQSRATVVLMLILAVLLPFAPFGFSDLSHGWQAETSGWTNVFLYYMRIVFTVITVFIEVNLIVLLLLVAFKRYGR